jgi:hypothetical protein
LNPKGGASSHFGIGYINGQLRIHQYVDLGDAAWTNGDAREPTWPLYQPGVNPNLTTITTEHEDGGTAGRGIVTEPVWQASIALSALLRSGSVDSIRGAGIHLSDRVGLTASQLVTQVAAWPIDATRYIDHHQIAGPNKPYCFRRWLDDPGFVDGSPSRRDVLLAALRGLPDTALEDPMPKIVERIDNESVVIERAGIPVRRKATTNSGDVYYTTKAVNHPLLGAHAIVEGDPYGADLSKPGLYVEFVGQDSGYFLAYVPAIYVLRRPAFNLTQSELDAAADAARADGIADAAAAAAAVK